jgi:hypothetical protein
MTTKVVLFCLPSTNCQWQIEIKAYVVPIDRQTTAETRGTYIAIRLIYLPTRFVFHVDLRASTTDL